MQTIVALAVLGLISVSGEGNPRRDVRDIRANIQKDLQNVIDSVTTTANSGKSIVQSAAALKLQRQLLCWRLAVNKVMVTAVPPNNALTQLYQEIDDLEKKLPNATDEEINGYLYDVLAGDNTYITRILASGDKVMANANSQIKGLSLDLTC